MEVLNRHIARRVGKNPEEITTDYINARRRARQFEVDETCEFGGRVINGLYCLTDKELEAARHSFDELVSAAGN